MNRAARTFLSISLILLVAFIAAETLWKQIARAGQTTKTATSPKSPAKKAPTLESNPIQTQRNIGKAYYEQGKYPEAIAEFQKVVASVPHGGIATDHLDLGLALMQANKLDEALGELSTAKQMDAKLAAADYNLGILYKRELRYPDAERTLQTVTQADPNDPAAWFNLGDVYFTERKFPEALEVYQRVVAMGFGRGQNFYVASLFHTFTTLIRLKRQPEAQEILKVHEKMRDRVPGISLQNPALEGGKYGAIIVPPVPAPKMTPKPPATKLTFAEITSKLGIALPAKSAVVPESEMRQPIQASDFSLDFARKKIVPAFNATIAVGDYDGDGRPDLYVVVPGGKNHLLHNNGNGTFSDATEKAGVAGDGAGLSATFADYDNSGHASLFVAGLGGVKLYRNNGNGTFTEATEKAGLAASPGELDTRAVLFDADDDGFLDLVVTPYTDLSALPDKASFTFPEDFAGLAPRLFRNNGDGTFTDVTQSSGLASARGRLRGAVFADFDNDGYADLLFVRDDGPPMLFMNQGENKFVERTAEAGEALANFRAVDAQVADFDHDGNFDVVLWSLTGYQVFLHHPGGNFEPVAGLPSFDPPHGLFAFRGTVVDFDGDGFDDLLAADSMGHWHPLLNRSGKFGETKLEIPSGLKPLTTVTAASLSSAGRLNLVATQTSGQVAVFERTGPPSRWLEVKLSGFKSNTQGIGAIVELKAGNFYTKAQATGGPVRVYTGDLAQLDVVRVTWPNQIVQNSINVATNHPLVVRESERLASSCPLLYAWNGERFVFVTDVLGVAPLGALAPDGSRIRPNPEEFVRLPHVFREREGEYVFQLTDELREVDYFDQARLLAVDHPASEEIYADEIFSSSPAKPALYAVLEKHFPVSAVDDHGHNVLPLLLEADGRYPADFRKNRLLGLADLHTLTLDLGELPASGSVALWLTGWVFWTDSNASRALISNSEMKVVSPYLQVRDPRGRWVTVIPDMGLPSGTNRTMRVDLTDKFLSADYHVRIVTNLCVYWDRIFYSISDQPVPAAIELPLVSADLHYRGFSTPASDREHLKPDSFDYAKVLSEAPWNPMRGLYTRYGDVEKLVERADDRLVVMATGDELTMRFDARALAPPKPGWKRDFFLDLVGYAKDGEPNTAFSKTVNPLPFREMSNYPYSAPNLYPETAEQQQYLREFETRHGYLLIPPLAPPRP